MAPYHLYHDSDDYFDENGIVRKKNPPLRGGITSTATRVGETWQNGHWVPIKSYKLEPQVKPSRARVVIEELDSNLQSGCRTASLKAPPVPKMERPPSWPSVFYITIGENNWTAELTFNLNLSSYTKDEDKIEPGDIWRPFITQDIEYCSPIEACFPKFLKDKKLHKAIQRFAVKLQSPPDQVKAFVPWIQFHCNAKWTRYQDVVFKEGDIITAVIRHPKYLLHWPNPPIITVRPEMTQTYVPMLPKQKLVIVTSKREHIVDFKSHLNSNIEFHGSMDANDFEKQCSFFECLKPASSSEIVFINAKKKKDNKKVVIPFVEKEVRCPVILNPLNNAVIHSQNIDGFVIRIWKESYHPISVQNGIPIRGVHTSENAQYIERRFEIEKRRPFFHLLKKDHSWVIC
jgi:hypothetical protein